MFKVNNKDRFGIFIVNFEHISHLVLVFLLLNLFSIFKENSYAQTGVMGPKVRIFKFFPESIH